MTEAGENEADVQNWPHLLLILPKLHKCKFEEPPLINVNFLQFQCDFFQV